MSAAAPIAGPWRRLSRGLEGVVATARLADGRRLRLKRFDDPADLRRYAVNAVLLARECRRLGYEADLRIPRLLAVDIEARTALSEFILRRPVRSLAARRARITARNAAVAAGGYLGAYDPPAVRAALLDEHRADLAVLLPRPPFHGLDLNDRNWVYDGAAWALIDF